MIHSAGEPFYNAPWSHWGGSRPVAGAGRRRRPGGSGALRHGAITVCRRILPEPDELGLATNTDARQSAEPSRRSGTFLVGCRVKRSRTCSCDLAVLTLRWSFRRRGRLRSPARTREVSHDHNHQLACCPGRDRARVHRSGKADVSRVPGRLLRPDPRGLRPGPAPVHRLVPPAAAAPVHRPPRRHRAVRPRPRSRWKNRRDRHPQAVHHRRTVQVRRRGRPARPLPGRAREAAADRLRIPRNRPGPQRSRRPARRGRARHPGRAPLVSLPALNGLRVSEATGADIEALGTERGHRTLAITRKGGKKAVIPLAPRTAGRSTWPSATAANDRSSPPPPGSAALHAGVPLRDAQEAASHADPRITMRYDRATASLDRYATYIVAAYLAGADR